MSAPVLLSVQGLATWFDTEDGVARAVDGVDLELEAGQTLGLVGESGCGKSVTALSILRLLPVPPARFAGGRVLFRGTDLLTLPEEELRMLRGRRIAMIFQEPMTALDPVFTVGSQIEEVLTLHLSLGREEARARAIELLRRVEIASPERRAREYPHQLSGGMRQRVMIAMAMACDPELLIADEPTTALDVTIQAQILELVRALQRASGTGVLLITHDLGVVAESAHQVAVMYAGKVVERAPVDSLFDRPRHPYTIGLFRALPDLAAPRARLRAIPGMVPAAHRFPAGCRFRTRCSLASDRCARVEPALEPLAPGSPHAVACHHLEEAEKL